MEGRLSKLVQEEAKATRELIREMHRNTERLLAAMEKRLESIETKLLS